MTRPGGKAWQEMASIRDTIESIWVAIVLAFVLRAFVVEAFVIPTGSMAPRLLGEHRDVRCKSCGYEYAFGGGDRRSECPNCGYGNLWSDGAPAGGDRVLVMKYLYHFRQPQPWDVVVFKNPQDNRQNYIKRLVGLPGETIEIVHGDVFVSSGPDQPFRIRRKDQPRVQDAMWQVVFDNDYAPNLELFNLGPGAGGTEDGGRGDHIPEWRPAVDALDKAWKIDCFGRQRTYEGGTRQPAWLTFHGDPDAFLPRYGYNTAETVAGPRGRVDRLRDIITDLELAVTYVPRATDSRLELVLTSFEHEFRGEIGADGLVSLWYRPDEPGGQPTLWGQARVGALNLGRGCQVALAHADMRVMLWVDGKPILQSQDRDQTTRPDDRTKYPMDYRLLKLRMAEVERRAIPTPRARIGASGGQCELWHIQLLRDVYYTAGTLGRSEQPESDLSPRVFAEQVAGVRQNDRGWASENHPFTLARFPGHPDLDQFLVLGDNSPSSLDGRCWLEASPTLRLYDPQGRLGGPLLTADNFRWEAFLGKLKAASAGPAAPEPAVQDLLGLLPADVQEDIRRAGTLAPDEDFRSHIVWELNSLLRTRELHNRPAWQHLALPPATAEMLQRLRRKTDLTDAERMEMNRRLLEAAFQGQISDRRHVVYQLGTVPRYSLIGKAVFVYWPAGFRLPVLGELPIIPNVGKMRLIR